jgi:hypothetical protein
MNPYESPQTEKQPQPQKRQSTTVIIVFVILVPALLGFFMLMKRPTLQSPRPSNGTVPAIPAKPY